MASSFCHAYWAREIPGVVFEMTTGAVDWLGHIVRYHGTGGFHSGDGSGLPRDPLFGRVVEPDLQLGRIMASGTANVGVRGIMPGDLGKFRMAL